jgi:hypothetical protein
LEQIFKESLCNKTLEAFIPSLNVSKNSDIIVLSPIRNSTTKDNLLIFLGLLLSYQFVAYFYGQDSKEKPLLNQVFIFD